MNVYIKSLCRCCANRCRSQFIKRCSKFKLRSKKFKALVKKEKIKEGSAKGMVVTCLNAPMDRRKYARKY